MVKTHHFLGTEKLHEVSQYMIQQVRAVREFRGKNSWVLVLAPGNGAWRRSLIKKMFDIIPPFPYFHLMLERELLINYSLDSD